MLTQIAQPDRRLSCELDRSRCRDTDASRPGNAFEPQRRSCRPQDVVAFDLHVTKISADAEQHSPVLGHWVLRSTMSLCALDRGPDDQWSSRFSQF
jgi:hypothetical protein